MITKEEFRDCCKEHLCKDCKLLNDCLKTANVVTRYEKQMIGFSNRYENLVNQYRKEKLKKLLA